MEVNVFPVEQPGGTFYYAKFKAVELVDRLSIRRRSSHADGIQRDLASKRIREISDYLLMADAILPTPLVVCVESAELYMDQHGHHIMQIPTQAGLAWGEIIDGQHRYEGLQKARSFDDYEIPVCIFVDLRIEDKAAVFSTINSTQVKVPKSYIYDLFDYTDANTPAKFGHDVCKTLNYDERGPLSRRIKMLGRKLNDTEVLSQGALVDAIIPLISDNESRDDRRARDSVALLADEKLPLRDIYLQGNTVVFSKIVTNYLRAVRAIADENWEKYILRSVGIKVFMRILGYLSEQGIRDGDLSEEFFLRQLSPIQSEVLLCSTTIGTNKRAEDETVDKLKSALKKFR
jgi:DGQHR domain-containing protein